MGAARGVDICPWRVSVGQKVEKMPIAGGTPAFDSYGALVVKKMLLPSEKTKYVAVERSFLVDVLRDRLEQIHVDEEWYLEQNPDVRDAIRDGVVQNARAHYASSGFFEHRMPYAIAVDEAWYLDTYEDIRRAVASAVFASGQAHFEARGYREGRLPRPGFRLDIGHHAALS